LIAASRWYVQKHVTYGALAAGGPCTKIDRP
jgi:hypothetical protein